jgi:hypothetical protein
LSNDEVEHICLDFDMACLDHLEWIEARQKAQEEVEVPPRAKSKRQTTWVPKYKTIEEVLALDVDDEPDPQTGEGPATLSRSEIADRADLLLRDREAYKAFIQTE